jgi:hypothetical protein
LRRIILVRNFFNLYELIVKEEIKMKQFLAIAMASIIVVSIVPEVRAQEAAPETTSSPAEVASPEQQSGPEVRQDRRESRREMRQETRKKRRELRKEKREMRRELRKGDKSG